MNDARSQLVRFRQFGFTFAATSSFIRCRTVADAVLLTRLGASALPPMLIIGALVVGSVSFLWARHTRHLSLPTVVFTTQMVTATTTAILLVLLRVWPDSMPAICGLFLLAELRGCFGAILVAVLLNEGTDRDSDKGSFAFVNAGAPLAGIVMGLFIGAEASEFRSTTFLGMCCCFDILAWLILSRSRLASATNADLRDLRSHTQPTVIVPTPAQRAHEGESPPYAKAILLLVVCKVIVLAIVGYEWKVFASRAFPFDEQALTAYFGLFYAISDGLILAVQLLATRHFLGRRGIAFSLIALPLYLVVIGMASLLTQDERALFWLLTLARGAMVIRRSLHDVALQVLYGWLPEASRRDTVTLVLGVAKPTAEAVAAVGIIVLVMVVPARTLAWVWLPILCAWFFATFRLLNHWKRLRLSTSGPDGSRAPVGEAGHE